MADIAWSPRARNDLTSIAEYIAQDSPRAARSWTARIFQQVERLAVFPLAGRIVPEYSDIGVRELIVGNYRIVYLVTAQQVEIARIWHGARPLTRGDIT